VVLVWWIGWVGAAVASVISAIVGLIVAYYILSQIISVSVPSSEISRQFISAVIMGGTIVILREIIVRHAELSFNFLATLGLIPIGAIVYILCLIIVSPKFRDALYRNLPLESIRLQIR
jgi:peptidoglycan biosynthesis protein MviN/MurJ (putative lipid II flippase)